jgi:glycerol-3-phosphate dehydrogenase (NAD(P)+)
MDGRKVCVMVAGSWGTALATVLADNGYQVALWTRDPAHADEINATRINRKFLPDAVLPKEITATSSVEEAVQGANAVLLAPPSGAMREVARRIQPWTTSDTLIIHATKGFEVDTLKRMTDVIAEELPQTDPKKIVVLSGPSHAEEVIRRSPTTVVVAAACADSAEQAQDLFMNSFFRVYTNPDVTGVEISGALKNIIALGAGLSDGLEFGDNAKAALITRGLAEIARLGIAMGANPLTFAGLAGVGDLIVTCTSKHSRNWRAGYLLAQGRSVDEVLTAMGMVVEGIKTTKSAYALAQAHDISMPITKELYHLLFEGKSPKHAVEDLMGRVRTHEIEEIAKSAQAKWTVP